jgi:hypothetical protein
MFLVGLERIHGEAGCPGTSEPLRYDIQVNYAGYRMKSSQMVTVLDFLVAL